MVEKYNKKRKNLLEIRTLQLIIILLLILLVLNIYLNTTKKTKEILVSAEIEKADDNEINEIIEENIMQNIIENKLSDWKLILVNKTHQLPENYKITLSEISEDVLVDERIADALNNMISDAKKQGLSPLICSSYRSYEKQKQLFDAKTNEYIKKKYTKQEAEELASYWVAVPNTGEHQTGLSVDIVSTKYQILDENQEKTKEQKWLMENSYKYGFILRYPTEKKNITMINYEPWHYRYVGVENATIIKEKGFCLEEYIDYLKNDL